MPEDWDFNSKPVLKEKIKTDFIEISDSCGNIWHGINSRLLIKEYNEFKGLEINEYFLMLPKVPVLCHVIEVSQDMKIFMKDRAFITKTFFNLNNDLTKSYVVAENEEHDFIKYRGGMGECLVLFNPSAIFEGENLNNKLQFYSNSPWDNKYCNINNDGVVLKHSYRLSLENGSKAFLNPRFYIMIDEHISDKLLRCLDNIMFF